jgi:hypothetical protein
MTIVNPNGSPLFMITLVDISASLSEQPETVEGTLTVSTSSRRA